MNKQNLRSDLLSSYKNDYTSHSVAVKKKEKKNTKGIPFNGHLKVIFNSDNIYRFKVELNI